jgi:hypothetical protein
LSFGTGAALFVFHHATTAATVGRENSMHNKLFRNGWYFDGDAGAGGAAGSGGNNGNGSGSGAGAGGQGGEEKKSFTQKELDSLFADRAKQAAGKAQQDLLDQFGVKTPDEAKALLQRAKDAEAAQLSELDKAKKAAADADTARQKAEKQQTDTLAKAQEKLMRASVIAEAAAAGFNDPNDAWLYLDKTKVKAKEDDTFEGVKEAVAEVVKSKPYLLKDGKEPPNIDAIRRNAGGKGMTEEEKRELAARYNVKPEFIK